LEVNRFHKNKANKLNLIAEAGKSVDYMRKNYGN